LVLKSSGSRAASRTHRANGRRASGRRRALGWTAKVTATVLAAGALTGFATAHKTVTLTVDGESTQVTTFGGSVGSVLAQEGVTYGERDLVAPAPGAAVPRGGEIVVRLAKPLSLNIDGAQRVVWTTAETVDLALADLGVRAAESQLSVARGAAVDRQTSVVTVSTPKVMMVVVDGAKLQAQTNAATVSDALTALGVVLGPDDQVNPALDQPTKPGQTITVERAFITDGSQTIVLPFEKVTKKDATMAKGTTKVVQEGKAGQRLVTYVATMAGDTELERTVVMDTIVVAPVDEITLVGTKEAPKPTNVPNVPINVSPGSAQAIAKEMMANQYGWGDDQFACLVALWERESGWRVNSSNPSSGAYGIPQALPGSKMASAGADWRTNPATQIAWGLGYIKGRYATPCGAWGAFQQKGWY